MLLALGLIATEAAQTSKAGAKKTSSTQSSKSAAASEPKAAKANSKTASSGAAAKTSPKTAGSVATPTSSKAGSKTSQAKTARTPAKSTAKAAAKTATKRTASKSKRRTPARPAIQQQPTPERYREIQQALIDRGFLQGEPTGRWDAASVEALKRFQADQQLQPTGKIDALSLIRLGLGPRRQNLAVAPPPPQPAEVQAEP